MKKKNQAIIEYLLLFAAIVLVIVWGVKGNLATSVRAFFDKGGTLIGNVGK